MGFSGAPQLVIIISSDIYAVRIRAVHTMKELCISNLDDMVHYSIACIVSVNIILAVQIVHIFTY